MRIVGGKWRGRPIEAPVGRGTTRPTTDRNREQMTSMVLSAFGLDLSGVSVLDAFGGSGAMGLELLSRGARSCTFVDRDRKAASVIRRNAKALGAEASEARVVSGDVFRLAGRGGLWGAPFSLLVLDPPYAVSARDVSDLVGTLRQTGQLAPGAVVLYEHAADAPGIALDGARVLRERGHGITSVELLRID